MKKKNSDSYDQDAEGNMNMRHVRRLISRKKFDFTIQNPSIVSNKNSQLKDRKKLTLLCSPLFFFLFVVWILIEEYVIVFFQYMQQKWNKFIDVKYEYQRVCLLVFGMLNSKF